jgi:hypothetical protein
MLFFPSTGTPYLGRIHLNLDAFEYWNNAGANGAEVKFDF